jgi:hypothetical protein
MAGIIIIAFVIGFMVGAVTGVLVRIFEHPKSKNKTQLDSIEYMVNQTGPKVFEIEQRLKDLEILK